MLVWLENAFVFVMGVVLGGVMLWAGVVYAWKSFVGARQMNLSRVNENGVRVWKNATDSIVAPWQIRGLYVLSAGWAGVALIGMAIIGGGFSAWEPREPGVVERSAAVTAPTPAPVIEERPVEVIEPEVIEEPPVEAVEPEVTEEAVEEPKPKPEDGPQQTFP